VEARAGVRMRDLCPAYFREGTHEINKDVRGGGVD
jgi:hypothetical protein